ncbi:hypothetical protein [Marinobacter orientalis]|uniref:Uncharacterized protein n=1 Tax=Marinobacter orientalis TaxID=1928859 RepID=A0A7Y0RG04_9GAMM|nr:hypothetical protein [Marinobacter orientalis]NMT65518.1 hypothetical protein [Marinobacter orientalis]TGX47141.1 hypothetical protein DIT72_18165 [Marinobacter orientalis]
MRTVYSYYSTALSTVLAILLMIASSFGWAGEPVGQLIDSPYEALEASSVDFVRNATGDVVGIQAKGCPGCPSSSILPARDFTVDAGRSRTRDVEIDRLTGKPGVIHVYKPTGMAHRVSFPGVVLSGGGEQ